MAKKKDDWSEAETAAEAASDPVDEAWASKDNIPDHAELPPSDANDPHYYAKPTLEQRIAALEAKLANVDHKVFAKMAEIVHTRF